MMRLLHRTRIFKRDVKMQTKRGKDIILLRNAITLLVENGELPGQYRDHPLHGGYRGSRECHIEPDWLLIYEITDTELVLIRTGTHADLFE